jgi:hypothetical protein
MTKGNWGAATAATITLAALLCGACSDASTTTNGPAANAAAPTNHATNAAHATYDGVGPVVKGDNTNVLKTPAERTQAPMAPGASTRITGAVVSLACMTSTPNASKEALAECSKQQASAGGALAVLGDDGAIYVSSVGPQTGTRQLQRFAGVRVFIDGNVSAHVPDVKMPGHEVKGFDIRGVRKEDIESQGPEKLPEAPKMGGGTPTVRKQ